MGWLKPAEYMLGDGDWDWENRRPPEAEPDKVYKKCYATARGKRVKGVRVESQPLRMTDAWRDEKCTDEEFELDGQFFFCPAFECLGFPLMVKRLPPPPQVQGALPESLQFKNWVMKVMTKPGEGLDITWHAHDSERLPPLV